MEDNRMPKMMLGRSINVPYLQGTHHNKIYVPMGTRINRKIVSSIP
jgi:hypothetical protein